MQLSYKWILSSPANLDGQQFSDCYFQNADLDPAVSKAFGQVTKTFWSHYYFSDEI